MNLSTFKLFKTMKAQPGWISLDNEQLKQLQTQIAMITNDIFSICNKYEICVMLAFGSVLGAVRHKGFIPWDDDMDIYMPRRDYLKFVDVFEKEMKHKYWLHTPEKTSNYGSLIAKVLLKDTIVRKYEDTETDECGVFVDVFIIENEFDNVILQKIHSFISYIFAGLVSCRRFYRDAKYLKPLLKEEPEILKVVKRKEKIGKLISFLSLDTWVHLADNWFQICKNDNSNYVSIPSFKPKPGGEKWERTTFGHGKTCVFDSSTLKIPCDYEKYLNRVYGDYMRIPPEDEREKHIYLEFQI